MQEVSGSIPLGSTKPSLSDVPDYLSLLARTVTLCTTWSDAPGPSG